MCFCVSFVLSALFSLAPLSCDKGPKETTLKPTVVLRGTHSAIRGERSAVVTSAAAWEELWKRHRGTDSDQPFTERFQELGIDFDTHYVVAIFTGLCDECEITPRGRGDDVVIGFRARFYSIAGRRPLADDKRTEREKAADEAADAKDAAKSPYAFVVLPKPVRTVVIEKDVRRSKFDAPLWKEEFRYPLTKDRK